MADNVIKAVFASGRRVKTAPLWRYDHGIRLQPIGLELPENYEMHFSNSETGAAKTVLADASGAVIPAEYLIPGTEVYAWIYLVGDSYGRTKAQITIPVSAKAKPTDQEPTPEQQSVIEQAIDALNDAQDALEEAASRIIESGITPEEREKLAGIEDGAEVNAIEEVRQYDPFRQKYVPLPVTDKGVNLPEIIIPKEVFYPTFSVEDSGDDLIVTDASHNPSEIVNVSLPREKVIIAIVSFRGHLYYLPLSEAQDYQACSFAGEIDIGTFLRITSSDDLLSWTVTMFMAVEEWWADGTYVAIDQSPANAGKVLTVDENGYVQPIAPPDFDSLERRIVALEAKLESIGGI